MVYKIIQYNILMYCIKKESTFITFNQIQSNSYNLRYFHSDYDQQTRSLTGGLVLSKAPIAILKPIPSVPSKFYSKKNT